MSKELQNNVVANVGEDAAASVVPPELPPVSNVFQNMVAKKIKNMSLAVKKLAKEFGHDVDVIVQVKIKE